MNITKTKSGIAGVVDEGPAGNCSWFCQQRSSAPPHRPRKRLWLWTGAIVFAAATAVLGQNILQNPGFEAGTEGWFIVGPGASIETVTERPHSGAAACRVFDRTALYCGVAQSVLGLMQPGVTYQCSAWVRLANATGEPISILIRQTDESNNGQPRHQPLARIIATSNEWTQLTGTFTLDVRGRLVDLIFYFEGPATGVDFLVDDVSITPAQAAEAQMLPARVEPSPPRDEAWNRIERLALMFGLFGILVSAILAAVLLAWLAARSRRGEPAGGGSLDQPPAGAEAPPKRGSRLEKLLWFGSVGLLLAVIFVVWQAWPRRLPQSANTAETIPMTPPEIRGGMSSSWTSNAPRFIPSTILPEVRGGMSRGSQTGTKPTLQQADTNGVFVLKAIEAEVHGQLARYEEQYDCIGFWMVREDYVSWTCDVMKPGRFSVAITYACVPGVEGSQYTVGVEAPAADSEPSEAPGSTITDTVKATDGWSSFITEAPGEIALPAGRHKIAVRALTIQSAVMNLRQLRLSPL